MQVPVHTAKTQLSKLIEAALAGEEVVIARGAHPVARLVAMPQSGFRIGILAGEVSSAPDFLAPMSEAETRLWEGE